MFFATAGMAALPIFAQVQTLVPGLLIAAVALAAIPAIRLGPETAAGRDPKLMSAVERHATTHDTDPQGVNDRA